MKKIYPFLLLTLLLSISCEKEKTDPCTSNQITLEPTASANNVLIIGVDGFRSDVLTPALSPFLASLTIGSSTYFNDKHQVEYYTSSGPNWTSILTGLHWETHQVVDNFFLDYDSSLHPSVFHYIEEANPEAQTSVVCHWLPITSIIVRDQADYAPVSLFSDSAVYFEGLELVNQSSANSSDVIFLHFDDLDHYGHFNGYHENIPQYADAVERMDAFTQGLFNAVEVKRNAGENWLICIVSDHGGEGNEHSDMPDVPAVIETILFVNVPGASFNSSHISNQADVTPTVLDYLGIESQKFNCLAEGVSLID